MRCRTTTTTLLGAILVASMLAMALPNMACYQLTNYRREAFVPGPQAPPYHGEPVGKKHVELRAQMGGSVVEQDPIPDLHDDALWIPAFAINASALIGVASILDLGLDVSYAYGSWARASTYATPPTPDGGDHLFTIGPQIALSGRSEDGRFFGGGYLTVQLARIPWSEWERTWDDEYELYGKGIDLDPLYRIGLFFGGRPARWLALFGGIVLQSAWVNDGFSDEPREESTLEQVTPTIMPMTGVRLDVRPVFFETAVTFPLSTEHNVRYIPVGWSVSVGVRL